MKAFNITISGQEKEESKPITQVNGEITLEFALKSEEIEGIEEKR